MVDLTPTVPEGRQVIQGYGGGGFRIAGARYEGSIIVFPDTVSAWPVASFDDITGGALRVIVERAQDIEVFLIGGGDTFRPLPRDLRLWLQEAGIAAEIMDTGAACRTYNLLLGDGRQVAAALISV